MQWILKNPIPGNNLIQSGIGLMIINNLAISVEGFITDILIAHLDNYEADKPNQIKELEFATWAPKKELYNKSFQKSLDSYSQLESVEVLFNLRNNLSHGLSHSEINKVEIKSGEKSNLESINKNYQLARLFLRRCWCFHQHRLLR